MECVFSHSRGSASPCLVDDCLFMYDEHKITWRKLTGGVAGTVQLSSGIDFMSKVKGGVIFDQLDGEVSTICMLSTEGKYYEYKSFYSAKNNIIRSSYDDERVLLYTRCSCDSDCTILQDKLMVITHDMDIILSMEIRPIDKAILMRNGHVGILDNGLFTVYDAEGKVKDNVWLGDVYPLHPIMELYDGRIMITHNDIVCLHPLNNKPFKFFRVKDRWMMTDAIQLFDGRVLIMSSSMMYIYTTDGALDKFYIIEKESRKVLQLYDGRIALYYRNIIDVYSLNGIIEDSYSMKNDIHSIIEIGKDRLMIEQDRFSDMRVCYN